MPLHNTQKSTFINTAVDFINKNLKYCNSIKLIVIDTFLTNIYLELQA